MRSPALLALSAGDPASRVDSRGDRAVPRAPGTIKPGLAGGVACPQSVIQTLPKGDGPDKGRRTSRAAPPPPQRSEDCRPPPRAVDSPPRRRVDGTRRRAAVLGPLRRRRSRSGGTSTLIWTIPLGKCLYHTLRASHAPREPGLDRPRGARHGTISSRVDSRSRVASTQSKKSWTSQKCVTQNWSSSSSPPWSTRCTLAPA